MRRSSGSIPSQWTDRHDPARSAAIRNDTVSDPEESEPIDDSDKLGPNDTSEDPVPVAGTSDEPVPVGNYYIVCYPDRLLSTVLSAS